jgi:glyoxylase-like metal-dependent hydrolase (beta-lactamase superfamily II)
MTTKVVQLEVGPMANFSYIIADENKRVAAVVDPSWDLERTYGILEDNKWGVTMIINTHNHFDHVLGNEQIASRTSALILHHHDSNWAGKYVSVSDGERISLGDTVIKVLHTPGHSKESISLLVNDEFIITGDTLFVGGCGRVDLAGGDVNEMFDSLYNIILQLNEDLIVYPGHNYGSSPSSTIGKEKKNNPALQSRNRAEFVKFMTS